MRICRLHVTVLITSRVHLECAALVLIADVVVPWCGIVAEGIGFVEMELTLSFCVVGRRG